MTMNNEEDRYRELARAILGLPNYGDLFTFPSMSMHKGSPNLQILLDLIRQRRQQMYADTDPSKRPGDYRPLPNYTTPSDEPTPDDWDYFLRQFRTESYDRSKQELNY